MIEPKTKTIDGKEIMVTPFLGRRSLAYKTRIILMFGASIGSLFAKAGSFSGKVDFSAFEDAITKLASSVIEKDFSALVLDLLQSTRIDGKEITPEVFDFEFAGNLSLMYKILWLVLEVNYGNFFVNAGIGKIISQARAAARTIPAK
jgi:hypothetical protein